MVCVGKADSNWLVEEEKVRFPVPAVGVRLRPLRIQHTARPELHEQPERTRTARSAVDPHDNIIIRRISSTLEEVEEEMSGLGIYVSRVCTAAHGIRQRVRAALM